MLTVSQAFAQNVLSKADVIQATGDAVCIFRELQCLTPRGRYTHTHTHLYTQIGYFILVRLTLSDFLP